MAPHSIGESASDTTAATAINPPHVIIIGAGVTGLLLAQGLSKAGIPFSIFEAESSADRARTREWGMSIHWSRPLLDNIIPAELLARIGEAQVDPSIDSSDAAGYSVPFYNGKTGEHIIAMPMINAVRVSRRKMRTFCSDGIEIKFGEKLADIQNSGGSVTATFESGLKATGGLIVGTDGPQSTVRKLLLGEEKAQAKKIPVVLYNMNVCYKDASKALQVRRLHKMNTVALQPEKALSLWTSIQDVPDPNAPETWQFQLMPTWLEDGKEHFGGAKGLAELKGIAESLAEPWRSSILWIPDDTEIPPPNNVAYWITSPWDNRNGTVTLAGDAAHPLPPHRGQGLNHCIADIFNLLTALTSLSPTTSLADAITAYDAELVKRGSDEVETSRKNALLVHDFERFMESPVLKQGYAKAKARKEEEAKKAAEGENGAVNEAV